MVSVFVGHSVGTAGVVTGIVEAAVGRSAVGVPVLVDVADDVAVATMPGNCILLEIEFCPETIGVDIFSMA